MDDRQKLEYEQASEDWRHRDTLTWQMPAVLVVVGGVVVAEAFQLTAESPDYIRPMLLLFAFSLAICLTIALRQNINLQKKGRDIIKALNPCTKRFCFEMRGSNSLLILSWVISIFLGALSCLSILSYLSSILCK
jgi:uncharacterized membrane protein